MSGKPVIPRKQARRDVEEGIDHYLIEAGLIEAGEKTALPFIDALELGLRRRFRGSLDHIRAMTCDNALAGANEGRRYLMLYDTVPGGTGYRRLRVRSQSRGVAHPLRQAGKPAPAWGRRGMPALPGKAPIPSVLARRSANSCAARPCHRGY